MLVVVNHDAVLQIKSISKLSLEETKMIVNMYSLLREFFSFS